jgi:hypothetical protein
MLRRVGPVAGLFLLAPLVGEYLLGNLSIVELPALPILAPLPWRLGPAVVAAGLSFLLGRTDPVHYLGNAVLAAAAVVLLTVTAGRLRRSRGQAQQPTRGVG